MPKKKLFSPIVWPVLSFAIAIVVGSILLALPFSIAEQHELAFIDAFFVATSAVCVTGLSTVDIGTVLSPIGQGILLLLIQLGGLGITTYTSLIFILWRNRVPISDHQAVYHALLNKDTFNARAFILQLVILVFFIEFTAAVLLYLHDPINFHPFNALFHAVSAFCNAGFSPFSQNLIPFKDDLVVNAVIGISIVLGGLGFAVLYEIHLTLQDYKHKLIQHIKYKFFGKEKIRVYICDNVFPERTKKSHFDSYTKLILKSSLALIVSGALLIFFLEVLHMNEKASFSLLLSSVFQSISLRTAGFNTVDFVLLSDATILIMLFLMFIGGAPGSCAGGVKITTFRVLSAFIKTQISGEKDLIINDRRVKPETVNQALTLFFFGIFTIVVSIILLCISENASLIGRHIGSVPLQALIFEVVSAFGTVGYTMNLTPTLSEPGKIIIILNMFIGRVGLIGLLTAMSYLRPKRQYSYPTMNIPIG